MPCYKPVRAYRASDGSVSFSEVKGDFIETLELPCGWCIGCRLERSRQWAVRCLHESKLHKHSIFVTLTYDDEHMPEGGSLRYSDFQAFMRRLRKHLFPETVRFFMCGEYGELLSRPHYHACLFNVDFPDKKLLSRKEGSVLYTSKVLSDLWTHGFVSFGDVTMASARYVAQYVMGKVSGDKAADYYKGKVPEFCHMSLKPGIGYGWFVKYHKDWYPRGKVVIDGVEQPTPRYYDKLFGRIDPDGLEQLHYKRKTDGRSRSWDNTDERLEVRERVARAKFKFHRER